MERRVLRWLSGVRAVTFIVLMPLASSCTDVEPGPKRAPIAVSLDRDTTATVSVWYGYSGSRVNDPTTERLFDRNNNTIWVAAEPECDVIAFELDLEAPRYLSSIRLTTRGGIQSRSMGIALYRPGDKDRLGQIYYEAQLDGANPLLVELPRDHFVRLFKAGSIRVDLVGCRSQEGRMQLSEVALELSDKPVFNPEMSVSKLFESVRGSAQYSSDGFWKFSQEGDGSSRNKFEAKNKYLAHLIYYGLAGNEKARNLFEKYAPPGTASGEDISYLKTWYEQEEKARSKK